MKLKQLFSEGVNFSIKSEVEAAYTRPCKKCGLNSAQAYQKHKDSRGSAEDPQCDWCYDYGGDHNPFDMQVCNRNARAILATLNIHDEDDLFGTIDPGTLLAKLEMAIPSEFEQHPSTVKQSIKIDDSGVVPGATIYDVGLSAYQMQKYFDKLRIIATRAAELDEPVVYS